MIEIAQSCSCTIYCSHSIAFWLIKLTGVRGWVQGEWVQQTEQPVGGEARLPQPGAGPLWVHAQGRHYHENISIQLVRWQALVLSMGGWCQWYLSAALTGVGGQPIPSIKPPHSSKLLLPGLHVWLPSGPTEATCGLRSFGHWSRDDSWAVVLQQYLFVFQTNPIVALLLKL